MFQLSIIMSDNACRKKLEDTKPEVISVINWPIFPRKE